MFVGDADLVHTFRLRTELFREGDFSVEIALPDSPEELIDEREFDRDERLPYWAELWPSARALARCLLDFPALPPRAIELGCGLGLPSLAMLHRQVDVLATDFYDDALLFARFNAAKNGYDALPTRLLDWRRPPGDLPRFPLAVAADVLYEGRNVEALAGLHPELITENGAFLLADPRRVYLSAFMERMEGAGWSVETLPERFEPSPAGNGIEIRVQLLCFRM